MNMKKMIPLVLCLSGLLGACDGGGTAPDPLGVRDTVQGAQLEQACIGICLVRDKGGSLESFSAEVVERCGKIRPCRAGQNHPD
jgi:hypothetical protein